jgi:porphobilinogen synthase
MLQETELTPRRLVLPVFVCEGQKQKQAISSLPGQYRLSIDELLPLTEKALQAGIKGLALFPVIAEGKKDSRATESKNPLGLLPTALKALKSRFPEMNLFSDVAMDPYSTDGHDGLVKDGEILNDETLPILAEMALTQAEAGADWVAASDMMDGRIDHLRQSLDEAGFQNCNILSYSAKYASSFYGPFRQALDSTPRFGDKKTYQMNPANRKEALRELLADEDEGADMLMVKPALPYLDIISDFQSHSQLPVAAYNVSGEYAMVKAAAEKGWLDEIKAVDEILLSIRRAGADVIFTYHALEWAERNR